MIYLAKGVPYQLFENMHNLIVWKNGKTYPLDEKQSIVWKILYGNIKTSEEIIADILEKYALAHNFHKSNVFQVIFQLKEMELIAFSEINDKAELLVTQKFKLVKEDMKEMIKFPFIAAGQDCYTLEKTSESICDKTLKLVRDGILWVC